MKKLALFVPILAAVALFAQPTFADDAHHHEKCAHTTHGETAALAKEMTDPESMMLESMEKMRAQMAEINLVKDSKKRRKLLQEHSQGIHDSIKMMREIMGDMAIGHAMGGDHKMCDHKMGDQKMDSHKMCDHKMSGQKMGGHMMDGHKMGSHKMDGNPASQSGSDTDAAPVTQANPDPIAATGKTSASQEGKLWICPMHPDVVRNQPGTCPICGMDLVEVEQPGASQAGHSHTMGGGMKCDCMMGSGMKGECMKGDYMKGGGMKCGCMEGGGMKCGCMENGGMKDDCMMGGGMKHQTMEMTDNRMDMMLMLMLMEQMIEHDEAEMAIRK